MKKIQDLQNQINDIQAQINKLEEPKQGFRDGDRIYYINGFGDVDYFICDLDFDLNKRVIKIGNAYHTREEAKRARDKQILVTELKAELDGEECDWDDDRQKKYFLRYNCLHQTWEWDFIFGMQTPLTIYSTKPRPDIIEKYGDRLNLLLEG